jgi:hypothetical protein
MKSFNTFLLLVIIAGLGANFYLDNKREKALNIKLDAIKKNDTLSKIVADPSPFDKTPSNPLMGTQRPPVADMTTISFEHTAHDFGRVESGPTYSSTFKYKNTGTANLYISAADASCGCTVATWSHDPIMPGASGEITVDFDSKGRVGEQLKTVTVTTNTEPNKNVLTLHTMLYLKTK